jgi:hypothetical protein
MADLTHRSTRVVDQRPEIVHDRVLELAGRLRDEAPPIEPGTQAATLLGMSGPLGIEVADRGPGRIEIRTTNGRVRGEGAVDIVPDEGGRTRVTMLAVVKPSGFAASAMLGLALQSMPKLREQIVDGLERGLDDLAVELAKPDSEWDAASWTPPGLAARR